MSDSESPQTPEEAGEQLKETGDTDLPYSEYDDSDAVIDILNGIRVQLQQLTSVQREYVEAVRDAQAIRSEGHSSEPEPEETDTSVTVEHDYDSGELESKAYDWIMAAGQFKKKLSPEWVEIEFGQVNGTVGLIMDAGNPWAQNQVDDGAPNDAWKQHQEAFKEVMQSEDSIQYHGKPDYFNFLPASDAGEVF